MPDEPGLEEQALSEAAEMTIAAQLDEVESLDVAVRTNLLKMVQGQVDSVSIAAQGVVMRKDIRVQEMELHTDRIAIDLLSAVFGQLELDKPVDATARVVLTEQDINRALQSDYVQSKLQSLELNVDGLILTLEPQQLKIYLPGDGKIGLSGTILLQDIGKSQSITFSLVIRPDIMKRSLLLEMFQCTQGEGIALELAIALLNKAKTLMDLPYFELEGMAFRLKSMDVQQDSVTLYTEAYVRQVPAVNPLE